MAKRPCAGIDGRRCSNITPRTRCADCERVKQRRRGTATQRGYSKAWRRLVQQAIMANPFCATCGSTEDLTGDHIVPLARGGQASPDNIQTLCRPCNGRKGARTSTTKAR